MSSNFDFKSVTMIDSLIGNEYSICLCSALHANGVDVELVAPDNRVINLPIKFPVKYWMPSKEPGEGKVVKTLRYFAYQVKLHIYMVKHKKERIVHFQFLRRKRLGSLMFPLMRLFGINIVFTAHNVLPHENNRIDYFLRLMVYKSAKYIIVHSNYMRNKLAQGFNIKREKIRVIPHGNFDHYLPEEPISKAEARASLNLSEDDKVALFFGFIREYKGLDLLLDAYEICVREGKPFTLIIAGAVYPLELERHYRRRIDQISENGSIVFHADFVPSEDVPQYFYACDVVVLPYKKIDHSGVVHLAYSFGKPIIATNVGDFSEVIEDGKSGYIPRENSAEGLSGSILKAFSNNGSLKELGNYAGKLSKEKYSWSEIAKSTKALYELC
jgi:glycosyltransferase involved in cell wall biosynthesis